MIRLLLFYENGNDLFLLEEQNNFIVGIVAIEMLKIYKKFKNLLRISLKLQK